MQVTNIKHLVLSGGGMLGISYIGLFKYLEENMPSPIVVKNLKSITGCSAGAMFATLIAIGYTSIELNTIVKTMNFKEYMNINAESLINFMRLKGLESGKKLISFIKKYIVDKTNNENITFSEIKEQFNIELQIGVTNLSKSTFEIMNSTNTPNIPIHKAISASIAIPFVFEPIIIGDDVYCDGGLLNNLPIEYFFTYDNNIIKIKEQPKIKDEVVMESKEEVTKTEVTKTEVTKESKIIESVLGIYLMNDVDTINKDNYQNISITQYIGKIIHCMSSEFINKKINLDNINNKNNENNEKYKIIIFKIPCDIMTFLKIKSSHQDVDNIIDIAYNITKESF